MNMLTVSANNISKYYGLTKALDAFSLDVPRNSIYALLGPNGAGKTTFIKCILGLIKVDEGTLNIFDLVGIDGQEKEV